MYYAKYNKNKHEKNFLRKKPAICDTFYFLLYFYFYKCLLLL